MTRFIINASHKINKKTLRQKKRERHKQKFTIEEMQSINKYIEKIQPHRNANYKRFHCWTISKKILKTVTKSV